MFNLTYCLITKGRIPYLEKILSDFDKLLIHDEIKIIVVDNGSDIRAKTIIERWGSQNPNRKTIFNLENNLTGFDHLKDLFQNLN